MKLNLYTNLDHAFKMGQVEKVTWHFLKDKKWNEFFLAKNEKTITHFIQISEKKFYSIILLKL